MQIQHNVSAISIKPNTYLDGSKATPLPLIEEMVAKIKPKKSDRCLVMFDHAMAVYLAMSGFKNVTLVATTINNNMKPWALRIGYHIKTFEEIEGMKFDVVLGNPPFSKANEGKSAGKKSINLYPEFFRMSLSIAPVIAMIMPRTDKQIQREHNELIVKNVSEILDISDDVFSVTTSVWCLFVNKNSKSKIADFTKKQTANDIAWKKGTMTSSKGLWQSDTGTQVIHAIHKDGPVVLHSNTIKKSAQLPATGFVTAFGITANNVEVIECNSQLVGVNVFTVWFETLSEAEEFKLQLNDKFKNISHLRGNQGVMNINTLKQIDFTNEV